MPRCASSYPGGSITHPSTRGSIAGFLPCRLDAHHYRNHEFLFDGFITSWELSRAERAELLLWRLSFYTPIEGTERYKALEATLGSGFIDLLKEAGEYAGE